MKRHFKKYKKIPKNLFAISNFGLFWLNLCVFSSKILNLAPLNLRFFPRIGYSADYSHFVSQKPTQKNAQIYLKIASKARSQTGSKLRAFTLMECMLYLLLIPGVFYILSSFPSIQKMRDVWRNSEEKNWHLFVQQFDHEWTYSKNYQVETYNGSDSLRLTYFPLEQNKKADYAGKIVTYHWNKNTHELIRANENHQGFEPILTNVASLVIEMKEGGIQMRVTFDSGKVQRARWEEKFECWEKGN